MMATAFTATSQNYYLLKDNSITAIIELTDSEAKAISLPPGYEKITAQEFIEIQKANDPTTLNPDAAPVPGINTTAPEAGPKRIFTDNEIRNFAKQFKTQSAKTISNKFKLAELIEITDFYNLDTTGTKITLSNRIKTLFR